MGLAIRCFALFAAGALLASCSLLFEESGLAAAVDGGVDAPDALSGTILFEDGFESGLEKWEIWSSSSANLRVSTDQAHSGEQALRCTSAIEESTQAALYVDLPGSASRSDIYVSSWVYLETGFPVTDSMGLLGLWSNNEGSRALMAHIWIEPGGLLVFKSEQGDGNYFTEDYVMPVEEWVPIQMHLKTNRGDGHVSLRVGSAVLDHDIDFTQDTPMDALYLGVLWQGESDKRYRLFWDDVLVADQLRN